MVERRGIGAASASAVIFSILLISGIAIYSSSQTRASLYSQSDFEDYLGVNSAAFAGASGANALLGLQTFLGGQTLDCATAISAVGVAMGEFSDIQSTSLLTESATAQLAPGAFVEDNLSSLSPFNGSLPGVVDLSLKVVDAGGSASAGVRLGKLEVHFLHLPVRLESAVADCLGADAAIVEGVSGASVANCTLSAVDSVLGRLESGLAARAAEDGFGFGLRFTIASTGQCTVGFQVSIEQLNIQGIAGSFDVLLEENGTATFEESA